MNTLLKLLTLFNLSFVAFSAPECPILDCTDRPREDKLCFKQVGGNPVIQVYFYPCDENSICDLDYT